MNKGYLYFLTSMIGLPFCDYFAQILLKHSYDLYEIGLGRFFIQTLLIILIMLYMKLPMLITFTRDLIPKMIMAVSWIGLTIGFYESLKYTSISIALSILFTAPLLTIISSAVILKQPISKNNIIACIFGLIGTLIIVRPASDDFNVGALYSLIGAVSFSAMLIVSHKYKKVNPYETQLFSASFSVIFYLMLIKFTVGEILIPTDFDFIKNIIPLGLLGGVFYALVQISHKYNTSQQLAPLQYIEIVSALLIDYFLVGIIPDFTTWLGISMILMSGLIITVKIKHNFLSLIYLKFKL